MQLTGQNSEDFLNGYFDMSTFHKSENLVQILGNFLENLIGKNKPGFFNYTEFISKIII